MLSPCLLFVKMDDLSSPGISLSKLQLRELNTSFNALSGLFEYVYAHY